MTNEQQIAIDYKILDVRQKVTGEQYDITVLIVEDKYGVRTKFEFWMGRISTDLLIKATCLIVGDDATFIYNEKNKLFSTKRELVDILVNGLPFKVNSVIV